MKTLNYQVVEHQLGSVATNSIRNPPSATALVRNTPVRNTPVINTPVRNLLSAPAPVRTTPSATCGQGWFVAPSATCRCNNDKILVQSKSGINLNKYKCVKPSI